MKEKRRHSRNELPADHVEMLYRRHFQGALVRSGASVVMWVFALVAYLANIIKMNHFTGISLSVLYLILINPPTLLLLKHITQMRLYKYVSLLINFLEILGYTAIIYFLGGIEATFLTPIYAALITYVAVFAPRSFTFIIAFLCSAAFSFVVISEYFGLLPRQPVVPSFDPPWLVRVTYLSVVIGLLLVVAYIGSLTSGILKKNRNKLREQNVELMEKAASLEEVHKVLRESEKRYRELSIVDDLTQLYNSRHFYFQLKSELDRSNRYEQPLTLLLLDLDNFKHFNDGYGHIEGDQVLQRLGQVVKRCLRDTDFAYRYGGEEFTILLPMTTSADGAVTAERIRTEFKKEIFSPGPGQEVHMTVSIGLAQYKTKEEMKAFVHRVDQLMYQGKKNGKDRVCSDS
ncbi:MAG: diguanylate cyclase [Deltaproteobacteria bacterium]|nr:MAG: diguanylate cyclase [Deltaproteobacteria bacterium]